MTVYKGLWQPVRGEYAKAVMGLLVREYVNLIFNRHSNSDIDGYSGSIVYLSELIQRGIRLQTLTFLCATYEQ